MSLQKKEYLSCHELLKDRLAKLVLIGRPNDQIRERERERVKWIMIYLPLMQKLLLKNNMIYLDCKVLKFGAYFLKDNFFTDLQLIFIQT